LDTSIPNTKFKRKSSIDDERNLPKKKKISPKVNKRDEKGKTVVDIRAKNTYEKGDEKGETKRVVKMEEKGRIKRRKGDQRGPSEVMPLKKRERDSLHIKKPSHKVPSRNTSKYAATAKSKAPTDITRKTTQKAQTRQIPKSSHRFFLGN
jgi:hypothetical protein